MRRACEHRRLYFDATPGEAAMNHLKRREPLSATCTDCGQRVIRDQLKAGGYTPWATHEEYAAARD